MYLLAHIVPQLPKTVYMWESMNVCVSAVVGPAVSDTARCFQTRWASGFPCGNAPGGRHSETPDHGSAPGHTKTQTTGLKCGQLPFCSTCACFFESQHHSCTCPCASTSSRWRTVPPSIPLSTYWPETELLSLTRKSPLQVRSDSACSRPNLRRKVQSYRERKREMYISRLAY